MTEFLSQYMSAEQAEYLQLAALAVLGVIIVLVLIRMFSGARERKFRAQHARLSIVDVEEVDGKRRLVLVRRDRTEHLIMIGGPSDIVIESGIGQRPIPAREPVVEKATKMEKPVSQPAPAAKLVSAPVEKPSAVDVKAVTPPPVAIPERVQPVTTPNPVRTEPRLTEVPVDDARKAELDGEIKELLAQMGRAPAAKPN